MKLYYGTYGHRLSGKLYVYWGDDNLRTGQQVVAPVKGKSGKTYNTMFTIARRLNEDNAESSVDGLSTRGISIKTISGRNTLSLPGAEKGGFETKSAWKRDSDSRYNEEQKARQERAQAQSAPRTVLSPEPPKHAVTPQYVKRVKEEQNQLTKAIRRFGNGNQVVRQDADDNARNALKRRQTVTNTIKQKQRLTNMRRR